MAVICSPRRAFCGPLLYLLVNDFRARTCHGAGCKWTRSAGAREHLWAYLSLLRCAQIDSCTCRVAWLLFERPFLAPVPCGPFVRQGALVLSGRLWYCYLHR